jgi:hypothetical protein
MDKIIKAFKSDIHILIVSLSATAFQVKNYVDAEEFYLFDYGCIALQVGPVVALSGHIPAKN